MGMKKRRYGGWSLSSSLLRTAPSQLNSDERSGWTSDWIWQCLGFSCCLSQVKAVHDITGSNWSLPACNTAWQPSSTRAFFHHGAWPVAAATWLLGCVRRKLNCNWDDWSGSILMASRTTFARLWGTKSRGCSGCSLFLGSEEEVNQWTWVHWSFISSIWKIKFASLSALDIK